MVLTDKQLAELKQIIADYHTAFVINYFGPQTVPDHVLARLRELGLVNLQGNAAEDAYLYGRLLQQLNTPQAAQMSYPDYRRYLRKHPIPLSPVEQQAVNIAAARGAQFVVGLGNKVATDTGELVIEGDAELRRRMQDEIKTAVAQGIAKRETIKDIKSRIGHATGDWTRDLDRIAATETSRAMNEGLAAELRAQHGHDVEVSVLSRKGCCPECASAYTGPDGAPIIFRLDDLEANGSNYKKKKADKLPVIPPYHPNCVAEGTLVMTGMGPARIEDIEPGMFVYTSHSRLKRVTHTWSSFYWGELVWLHESGRALGVTPNHQVHTGVTYCRADQLKKQSTLVRLGSVHQPLPVAELDHGTQDATLLFGATEDGEPAVALILPQGIYLTQGIYPASHPREAPHAVALSGRLMFATDQGLPSLCSQASLRLQSRDWVADGGRPVVFRRVSDALAQVIELADAVLVDQDPTRPEAASLNFQLSPDPDTLTAQAAAHRDGHELEVLLDKQSGYDGPRYTFKQRVATYGVRINGAGVELAPVLPPPSRAAACELILTQATAIERRAYTGLVYNLTVEDDESYIAGGLLVHNCACTVVRVPPRFGYNEDNDMVPRGKLGLRPHADTVKSMHAEVRNLMKADTGPRRLTWHGLRIHNLERVPRHQDIYQGALETPTGDHICILGPDALAADAYIAHGALADCIMLGFRNGLQAAMVLGTMSQPPHPLAVSRWSTTPVHELVTWAGGADTAHTIDQAGPKPACPLTKADTVSRRNLDRAKRRAPRDSLDGRLVLPVYPPQTPPAKVGDPAISLPLGMRMATAKVKVVERPEVPVSPPVVHPIRATPDAINAQGNPDDPEAEQVRLIIRERALRRPVRDLETGE